MRKDASSESVYLEDDNGGDFIELEPWGDETYKLTVGQCCVIVLEQEGTISEICEWFANVTQLEKRAMLS